MSAPEAAARKEIDRQNEAAGWTVNDLRFQLYFEQTMGRGTGTGSAFATEVQDDYREGCQSVDSEEDVPPHPDETRVQVDPGRIIEELYTPLIA